jgi:phosphoglycolate phosphatase-like HAD superfamily hydrolase
MSKRLKFVLFDIDQTLLHSAGAGRMAMNLGLEELAGVQDGFEGMNFAGKTDPQIFREALAAHGHRTDDEMVAQLTRAYLRHFPRRMAETPAVLKPGVPNILEAIQSEETAHLGLLTGNIEEGARLKLARFDLNRFFPVGAYGSDSEHRNELLPVAVRRLERIGGVSIENTECVIIGDSPRDVECAAVHGARSIAVATGHFTVEELQATGADLVLPDLSDTKLIVQWITAV